MHRRSAVTAACAEVCGRRRVSAAGCAEYVSKFAASAKVPTGSQCAATGRLRLYNVRRWTVMPHGGHFAAAEEPELVARDISAFFATLDR